MVKMMVKRRRAMMISSQEPSIVARWAILIVPVSGRILTTCGSGGTADALASGASWSNPVGVQIPASAYQTPTPSLQPPASSKMRAQGEQLMKKLVPHITALAIALAAGSYLVLAQQPPAGGGQGRGGPPQPMSFFITSVPKGDGANYGGLAGADAYCTQLATAAGRGA